MSDNKSLESSAKGLKNLDINKITLYENYGFKDPSDKSNELQIFQYKDKVCIRKPIFQFNT